MSKLQCPHCAAAEGRCRYTLSYADRIYRRRKCTACDKTYTTVEVLTPPGVRQPNPSEYEKFPAKNGDALVKVESQLSKLDAALTRPLGTPPLPD